MWKECAMLIMDVDCRECFKIKCRGCGWEPDDTQVELIQKEVLTECPVCNWSPKTNTKP